MQQQEGEWRGNWTSSQRHQQSWIDKKILHSGVSVRGKQMPEDGRRESRLRLYRKTYNERLKSARAEYGNLDDGTQTIIWEKKKGDYLGRQPLQLSKKLIVDSIRRNLKISLANVEAEINHWYSTGVIQNWLIS